jgi:hypothetical protein
MGFQVIIPPDLTRLPVPDEGGIYWFGKPGLTETPAIFPFRSNELAKNRGKFFVSLGQRGLVFEGPYLRPFDTPDDALYELRRQLERRG